MRTRVSYAMPLILTLLVLVACGHGGDHGGGREAARDAAVPNDAAYTETDAGRMPEGDGGIQLPPGQPCTARTCTRANGDSAAICAQDTQRCVPLLSPVCPQVEGPYQEDGALIAAVVEPGWSPAVLAAREINPYARAASGRPLVLLRCEHDRASQDAVMDHLIDDLGLPALIAPRSSDDLIALAERGVSAGMFMISATAAAPAITSLSDDGLVWRIAPSGLVWAPALAASVAAIEKEQRAQGLQGALRVAVVTSELAATIQTQAAVTSQLRFNDHAALDPANAADFASVRYPTDTTSDSGFNAVADEILAHEPHVVIGIGSGETLGIVLALEARWKQKAFRPQYVLGAYAREAFWLNRIDADLAARVRGAYTADRGPGYAEFTSRLKQEFGADDVALLNQQYTYDAAYALAYAGAAAAARGPVSGAAIARGMSKLVAGPEIDVGPGDDASNIQKALARLSEGEGIDLQGITGNLDFDLETGEPAPRATPVQIWCVGRQGEQMLFLDSGQLYDPTSGELTGDFACPGDDGAPAMT